MENDIKVPVIGEADRSDLMRIVQAMAYKNPDSFLTKSDIRTFFKMLPQAIGYWLANAEPEPDGSLRGEMADGLIVRAVPKPERSGEAFGKPFTEPEHFDIFVKFEAGALAHLERELGKKAKNA